MIIRNRINITAHAGCMGTEMDSIESVKAGIRNGAHIIEVDLNIDENDNLVLCHDKPMPRKIYTKFEEVLKVIKGEQDILLNIDVKDTKALDELNNIILEYGMEEKVFLTGLDYSNIIENKEKLSKRKYFINLEPSKLEMYEINDIENLRSLFDEITLLNIIGININYNYITAELIWAAEEKGLLTSVWTVDDEEDMKKMMKLQVNSITTKRVNILNNIRR